MRGFAQSQFFFLRNRSISSAANSCGSRLCLNSMIRASIKGSSRSNNMPTTATGILNKFSMTRPRISSTTMGGNSRGFVTFAARQQQQTQTTSSTEPIPEVKEATRTIHEAYKSQEKTKKRPRPMNSSKSVGYWLIGSAGLVFGIVVVGGLTRLTESGLSITEWKPVTGSIPPLNEQDWEKEFELYRSSPEFQILNSNMTLEEFKFIYFMEWIHRLWGRAIGLAFVFPAAYFIVARKTSIHTTGRLVLISGLIGLQGFIGWWMVKSGLNQDFLHKPGSHPRVSQYRLATHLGAAFLLYIAMFNTGLDILKEHRWIKNPKSAMKEFASLENPMVRNFRRSVFGLVCLVFVTAMSGAFVAGLDAGLIYNSFPYMGETIVPPSTELFSPIYSPDKPNGVALYMRNMLENPTTVQLNHRILAVTTFCSVFAMHMYSLKLKPFLPRPVIKSGAHAMAFVTLQAALGISTLIYVVPTELAALHQAGSLALLTSVLILASRIRLPRTTIKYLVSALAQKK